MADSGASKVGLLHLPNELLLRIAGCLDTAWDLNGFAQTNKFLHLMMNPVMYRYNIEFNNSSALSWAAEKGNISTVRLMVVAGADLETYTYPFKRDFKYYERESHGKDQGPLHLVVNHRHETAFYLVRSGARVDVRDCGHKSALDLAVMGYDRSLNDQRLITYMTAVLATPTGSLHSATCFTPIIEATRQGHLDLVRFFLNMGVSVDTRVISEDTLLHLAVKYPGLEQEEVALLLLERGANPNLANAQNATPIFYAVYNFHATLVSKLLDMGVNIHSRTIYGQTLLDHARNCDKLPEKERMIALLEEAGAC